MLFEFVPGLLRSALKKLGHVQMSAQQHSPMIEPGKGHLTCTKRGIAARALVPVIGLALIGTAGTASAQDAISFVPVVQFKGSSAATQIAGVTGSLSTNVKGADIIMRLTDVAMSGADKNQELITLVSKSDLSLKSSVIADVVKGAIIREMRRKIAAEGTFGDKNVEVFEYKETKDNNITRSEPYIEFKVVDFLSVMLVAADAINRKETKPIDLSMLYNRAVARVQLTIVGPATVAGRAGTKVRVGPPENPAGGIHYVISKTDDGKFYPAQISAQTGGILVELEGVPLK